MEAIMFLNIKNSVFFNVELECKLKEEFLSLNLVLEDYNLNQSTYVDFIDYLEFQEYRKLYIIIESHDCRIQRFKTYIQEHCATRVEIVVLNDLTDIVENDNNIYKKLKYYKEDIINDINKNKISVLDGLYSLISGIYPDEYSDCIKHLFIDKASLVDEVDKSVFDNMLINGCIVIREDINQNIFIDKFPHIFIDKKKFDEGLKNSSVISEDLLRENIEIFFKNGIIKSIDSNNITDYMSNFNKYYITRVFVYEDGIYCDFGKTTKLATKLNASYYNLKLRISDISSNSNNFSSQILKLFFILNSLSNNLNFKNMIVTSPYNKGIFKEQAIYNKPFDLIGIQGDNRHLCYSIKNCKIYETERDFNLLLEAYYKDEFENLPSEVKSKIDEFKEIIENVK